MTKGELIKFLEPFEDDIRLITIDREDGAQDAKPEYKILKTNDHNYVRHLDIKRGEGFIVL